MDNINNWLNMVLTHIIRKKGSLWSHPQWS